MQDTLQSRDTSTG